MPRLTIDGQPVDVGEGTTLLAAAQQAGVEIPTLCHAPGVPPRTTCMVCVVQDAGNGRMLPSCTALAEDGMTIDASSETMRAARREVLELLLAEHVGDCEAPCRRTCPASLNVPLMLRLIAQGDLELAARLAKEALVLPVTLGWVCTAPCEKACRRGVHDEAIAIRDLHRLAGEQATDTAFAAPPAPSGKRVAVVGGGPAGLAAAWVLLRRGHACRLFEKREQAGGALRRLPPGQLPQEALDAEIESIQALGAEIETNRDVGTAVPVENFASDFGAVVIACGGLDYPGDSVFQAREHAMTVRAVANGKAAAERADRFLSGRGEARDTRAFDSKIGKLRPDETESFLVNRVEGPCSVQPRQPEKPREEALRCLHCDCLNPVSCKLRRYAEEYGAKQATYRRAGRRPVEGIQRSGGVLYEPGKCIKCGLCVEITRRAGEPLGMAFIGRGFDVAVQVPLNRAFEEGLSKSAHECVEACPTGALAFHDSEERKP